MSHFIPVSLSAAVLALCLGVASCASTAPTASPTVARTAPTPQIKAKTPGFRRVVRDGTEYFCAVKGATGSRTRTREQCYTRAVMDKMEAESQEMFKEAGMQSSHDSLRMDSPR